MTAEPMPRIASGFDRLHHPGPRPYVAPCADCAPERDAAATREAEWRRAYGDLEGELAAANRELARLRRTYEPTEGDAA